MTEDLGEPIVFEDPWCRWDESLADIRHDVLLDRPKVCLLWWGGEILRHRTTGRALSGSFLFVTSFMEPAGPVTIELPVTLRQPSPVDDPYAYVPWAPLKKLTPRFYKRLAAFSLFKSINQKATQTVIVSRLVLAANGQDVFGMEAHHLPGASGEKYGGFDTLDNRVDVLQPLTPEEHRRVPRERPRGRLTGRSEP